MFLMCVFLHILDHSLFPCVDTKNNFTINRGYANGCLSASIKILPPVSCHTTFPSDSLQCLTFPTSNPQEFQPLYVLPTLVTCIWQ